MSDNGQIPFSDRLSDLIVRCQIVTTSAFACKNTGINVDMPHLQPSPKTWKKNKRPLCFFPAGKKQPELGSPPIKLHLKKLLAPSTRKHGEQPWSYQVTKVGHLKKVDPFRNFSNDIPMQLLEETLCKNPSICWSMFYIFFVLPIFTW